MNIDWSAWGPPLAVVGIGAVMGFVSVLRSRGGDRAVVAEGSREDLAGNRVAMIEALKALELERDKLDPDAYQREREALLARGAAAARALDVGIDDPADGGLGALTGLLRAERDRVGPEIFASAARAVAPELAATARPVLAPEWKGAGSAFALCAVAALLYGMADESATDRRDGASMTGKQDLGAAPPAGAPAMPPQWEAARAAAASKLDADPQDLAALNEMTRLQLSAGDATQAMAFNQRAFAVAPADPDARTYKAVMAAMVGMYDKALTDLDAVLVDHPQHAAALTYKGLVLLEMGRAADAIPVLESAVQANPADPNLVRLLGRARQVAAGGGAPAAPPTPAGPAEVLLSGTIQVDPAKAATLSGQETVYVSLRDPAGGPPLGAVKLPAGPFPLAFEVTTANLIQMGGARPIPAAVDLKVRIDVDGNPMTQEPGMPVAEQKGVAKGTTGVAIALQ